MRVRSTGASFIFVISALSIGESIRPNLTPFCNLDSAIEFTVEFSIPPQKGGSFFGFLEGEIVFSFLEGEIVFGFLEGEIVVWSRRS